MNICLVTGSRADWGLLEPLAQLLHKDPKVNLQILLLGKHKIVWPGFIARYDVTSFTDTEIGVCQAMSYGMKAIPLYVDTMDIDMAVVLGDRYEILTAATVFHVYRIPIVHIHGGELTYGAYDDAFRHSITKMSQLHFAATEQYRKRIIQMGEDANMVFNVGALGCEGLKPTPGPREETLLVLYHPVTLDGVTADVAPLLEVLKGRPEKKIFISSNADNGGQKINNRFRFLVNDKNEWHLNMPRSDYMEILKTCKAIVGNSSSGIIEAPAVGTPTINVGNRQAGREMASSIIQAQNNRESISEAFNILDKNFIDFNYIPYQGNNVAMKMVKIIKNKFPLQIRKQFYDRIA